MRMPSALRHLYARIFKLKKSTLSLDLWKSSFFTVFKPGRRSLVVISVMPSKRDTKFSSRSAWRRNWGYLCHLHKNINFRPQNEKKKPFANAYENNKILNFLILAMVQNLTQFMSGTCSNVQNLTQFMSATCSKVQNLTQFMSHLLVLAVLTDVLCCLQAGHISLM